MNRITKRMREGFTLVEILVVVIIIGILAAIAIPTYLNYVKRGYASDAKVAIQAILTAAENFYQETNQLATDVELLKQEGHLGLKKATMNKWSFQLELSEDVVDGLLGAITAISTAEMKGGEGKMVAFDIETSLYSGYGTDVGE